MQDTHAKPFTRYLTEDEEKRLFNHIWQFRADILARRDWHWMMVLRQTGLRIGTLARLTVGEARQALREPYRLELRAEACKGGRSYTVRFTRKARRSLRALLAVRAEQGHAPLADAPLIMSRNHRPLSVRSYQDRLRKWCLSAGLDAAVSPHWFRHTLAKRALERSVSRNPLLVVQQMLGHGSITSTAIYTRPDREEIDEAFEVAS